MVYHIYKSVRFEHSLASASPIYGTDHWPITQRLLWYLLDVFILCRATAGHKFTASSQLCTN